MEDEQVNLLAKEDNAVNDNVNSNDSLLTGDAGIGGTMIWYYYICPRQVWLLSHQLTPDQEDENIIIGRYLEQASYQREKRELILSHSKMDIFRAGPDGLVIGEVKKSSSYKQSAKMQLAFYLKELQKRGIKATGELRFPLEKKKEVIYLNDELIKELTRAEKDILRIIYTSLPPPPKKIKFCRKCAYREFCWA